MKCEQRCRQLVGLEVDTNEWLSDFVNRRGEQRRELAGNFPERYEDLRETQEEAAKYFNDLQERRIAHEAALRNAEQQSESYADTRLKRRDCPAAAFHYHFKKQLTTREQPAQQDQHQLLQIESNIFLLFIFLYSLFSVFLSFFY
ncbi:hypothetical protein TKK_0009494 [Trichogramma kaykai]